MIISRKVLLLLLMLLFLLIFFFCYVDLTYSFQILKKKMDSFGFLSNSGNGGFMGWEGEMSRKKKISSGYLVISANCFKTKCSG